MLTIYALPFVVSSYWFSFKSSSFCRWCRKKVKKLKKAKLKMERNQLMARLMLVFFPVFLISRFLAIFFVYGKYPSQSQNFGEDLATSAVCVYAYPTFHLSFSFINKQGNCR